MFYLMICDLLTAENIKSSILAHHGRLAPHFARSFVGQAVVAKGRLAQLVRAFDSHSKGRRFESSNVHHVKNRYK